MLQTLFSRVLAFALLLPALTAQFPRLLPFQGRLTDAAGTPVQGTVRIIFRLYGQATGGILWAEIHNTVAVNQGLGVARLPIPPTPFSRPVTAQALAVTFQPPYNPGAFTNLVQL